MNPDEKLARMLMSAMGNDPNGVSPSTGKPAWTLCLPAARNYLSEIGRAPVPDSTPEVEAPKSAAAPEGVVLSRGDANLILTGIKGALRFVPQKVHGRNMKHPTYATLVDVEVMLKAKLS